MGEIDFSSPEGRQLLKNLYAFARGLYNQLYRTDVNNRGKSFKDYVHEALDKYFRAPEKYDPQKSPIEYYLKYNLIRNSLYNDLPTHKKKEYLAQKKLAPEHTEMMQIVPEPEIFIEPDDIEVPVAELTEHDRSLLLLEIEKQIEGDSSVEQIYLAVAHEKYNLSDRKEICEECNISTDDFDNGRRRFKTVLNRVFKALQLIDKNGTAK